MHAAAMAGPVSAREDRSEAGGAVARPGLLAPDLDFLPPGQPRGISFCSFHTPLRPLVSGPGAGGAEAGTWPPTVRSGK